nr:unnamed protein product [Digitaria exilis]
MRSRGLLPSSLLPPAGRGHPERTLRLLAVLTSTPLPAASTRDPPGILRFASLPPSSLVCSGSCAGPSDEISPLYSLWATFVGLYIANFVVERSTGWALTHPSTDEEDEKLKRHMKPDFLDMVPWTSADLFKTAFDLMVSVTLFVGRFDMRMMQAAMKGPRDDTQKDDLLYDYFNEREDLWYPNPSSFTYERRFFKPFEYALQPPP